MKESFLSKLSKKRALKKRERELKAEQEAEILHRVSARRTFDIEQELESERQVKLELVKNLETAGRYEEAAAVYDELEMYEKAGECRRLAKTSYRFPRISVWERMELSA